MPSISEACNMVEEFHMKNRVSSHQWLDDCKDREVRGALLSCAFTLEALAQKLQPLCPREDRRGLRGHLCIEEVGEMCEAMALGDEERFLDALGDLFYVLAGTAVTYDMPLEEVFIEIHRSNMTKEKQADDPNSSRLRSKGPNYSPPDIRRVLQEYRGFKRDVRAVQE